MSRVFSPAFLAALDVVLQIEGGWSDHADDPGGATMRGITLKLYREWKRNPAMTKADLKAIALDEVREIYHDLFWRNIRGDDIAPAKALMLFDAAVNSGPKNAILAAQRTLAGYSPFKIIADGVFGPQTLQALNAMDVPRFLDEFATRRTLFYALLRTFTIFGRGWIRRIQTVKRAADLIHYGVKLVAAKTAQPQQGNSPWPTA